MSVIRPTRLVSAVPPCSVITAAMPHMVYRSPNSGRPVDHAGHLAAVGEDVVVSEITVLDPARQLRAVQRALKEALQPRRQARVWQQRRKCFEPTGHARLIELAGERLAGAGRAIE